MRFYRTTLYYSIVLLILICVIGVFSSFKNTNDCAVKAITHTVIIQGMKFEPEVLKVKKGDRVEWINKDIVVHDVTEVGRLWTSGPLKSGEKWSKTITEDFTYFCSIHIIMKAAVELD